MPNIWPFLSMIVSGVGRLWATRQGSYMRRQDALHRRSCEADTRGRWQHQWALILRLRRLSAQSAILRPKLWERVRMNDSRQYAPATLRNRDFILGILRDVLPTKGVILEIASGSGEHVVHFARHLPSLVFQPSDREPDALQSVAAWVKATRVTNVRAPVVLDASQSPWPIASADGIICINMVHISPWDATLGLIRGAAAILPPTAPFYLYGPYKREGFRNDPEQPSVRPKPS